MATIRTTPSKAIGVTHDRRLSADRLADTMMARCSADAGAGDPCDMKYCRNWGETAARRRFEQRDIGGDDRRVELFALGDKGLDRGRADRAAEIVHHFEEVRGAPVAAGVRS